MVNDLISHRAKYVFPFIGCLTVLSTIAYYLHKSRAKISGSQDIQKKAYWTLPSPPNKFPIIGHLLSLGKVPSKQVSLWHKEIGPIYQLQMGSQPWIMISDPYIAHEIFVTNSRVTSSRPYHTYAVKIYGRNNKGIVFTQYSSKWRSERKAAISVLSPKSVDRFEDILHFEADCLIERLAATSERDTYFNPYEELQLCALNFVTTTCLARRFTDTNDPTFRQINEFVHGSMIYAGIAGDIGSYIPGLAWLDIVTHKKQKMAEFVATFRDVTFPDMIDCALNGNSECLIKNLYQILDEQIDEEEENKIDEDDILVFLSDFISAGGDTIACLLSWTFAILSQKLEVQLKIIEELDAWKEKHGTDLLPVYNTNREEFPYTLSVQKEIMRFRPTTNFGIPHIASEELIIGNYAIPKGATLLSSMAAMHMNPLFFKDPEVFKPERYMNDTKKMASACHAKIYERDHFNFGWGRRICPAIHLVETEIFNIYVRLFSRFTLGPEADHTGKPLYTDLNDLEDYGVCVKPLPFKICLIPRVDI